MTQTATIFNDRFEWDGWGGAFKLGSGRCHLIVYDLNRGDSETLSHLKPFLVIVTDMPDKRPREMSVRSCTGHIATTISHRFNIDPQRMIFVEYYPASVYGVQQDHHIPERFDLVEFAWTDGRAYEPRWKALTSPLRDQVKALVRRSGVS